VSDDPSAYNLKTVRELLLAAFTAKDLRRLCRYDPRLEGAVAYLADTHGLHDVVDTVITYCETRDLLPDLLDAVAEERRAVYNRYTSRLVRLPLTKEEPKLAGQPTSFPLSKQHELSPQPVQIDLKYRDQFFHWGDSFATSFRLFGASDEFFPPSVVHVVPHKDARYELPGNLLLIKEDIVNRLKEEARQRGAMFFDGPNTRLIDYHATPVDKTEQKHVYLHFGPIGWHDYSVCRWALDHAIKNRTIDEIDEYVDLDEIANAQIIRNNMLPNILCTATTLITADRFVLYSRRGSRVSAIPGRLTSCIAENIHQVLDCSLEGKVENELPSPFRTVLRGIAEEASPKIAQILHRRPTLLFLLGLDFELLSFQPDLLFVVFIPFGHKELLETCRQYPGKDFIEGRIQAVPISPDPEGLEKLLSDPNWIPSGKASVIRALEFLDSVENASPNLQFEDIIRILEEDNN
jgi:hypothetical protein